MLSTNNRSRRERLTLLAVVSGCVSLGLLLIGCSPEEETSTIPQTFRDLDRVVAQDFGFLVDRKGCNPPTVEYWRDYFLVYSLPEDLRFRIGMERGTVVPFIFIEYHQDRLVLFHLPQLLDAMGLFLDDSEFPNSARLAESFSTEEYERLESTLFSEWPKHLRESARVLDQHFDAIVSRVQSASQESGAQEIGYVMREGVPVIGAGAHFLHRRILPIERNEFWRIVDRGFAPSYAAATCPLCGETGNMGIREQIPTSFFEQFRRRPVELYCLRCDEISVEN